MLSIDFLIPCYNGEKWINSCITSILKNIATVKDAKFKIICVDDGSTDNSLSMLKHLAMKNNIITVVHQENHGICYTRKVLIDICKADYFMFIDIDDTLCENSLAKCLKENIANYKIITMKCNYKNFNGRKKFNFYNRGIQTFLPKVSLDASKYIRRQRFGYTIWRRFFNTQFVKTSGYEFPIMRAGDCDYSFVFFHLLIAKTSLNINVNILNHFFVEVSDSHQIEGERKITSRYNEIRNFVSLMQKYSTNADMKLWYYCLKILVRQYSIHSKDISEQWVLPQKKWIKENTAILNFKKNNPAYNSTRTVL